MMWKVRGGIGVVSRTIEIGQEPVSWRVLQQKQLLNRKRLAVEMFKLAIAHGDWMGFGFRILFFCFSWDLKIPFCPLLAAAVLFPSHLHRCSGYRK